VIQLNVLKTILASLLSQSVILVVIIIILIIILIIMLLVIVILARMVTSLLKVFLLSIKDVDMAIFNHINLVRLY